ncbi:MAG: MoaD family protein [Candidatus Bathyarchaeota archaeon]|nr:MAG: MoaD family protein [Candidatus Bathyarchaeota archaeon]
MTGYVRVLLAARFREIAGQRELLKDVSSGMTLRDLLETLAETYGRDFTEIIDSKTEEISLEAWVMVNGKSARSPDVKLKAHDVVLITVPVGGG